MTIMEVEEIYGHAPEGDKKYLRQELKDLKGFDFYLTVNDIIPDTLGLRPGTYHSVYGVYRLPERKAVRYQDGKIHVVYAGTIEQWNKGASTAAETARYLPDNYVLHIAGTGLLQAVEDLKKQIREINQTAGKEKIQYHGFLSGQSLTDLLHACSIGINTYELREAFANAVFPSKLMTYMTHGLHVVVGRAECYERSAVAMNWTYYEKLEPKEIADAVCSVNESEIEDNSKVLCALEKETICFLKDVIEGNQNEGKLF